jgi:hypothetical protein
MSDPVIESGVSSIAPGKGLNIATHLFILHNAPTAPVVLLALTSFVRWGRRAELAKLLGRP